MKQTTGLWTIFVRGKAQPLRVALAADEDEAIGRWRRQTRSTVPRSEITVEREGASNDMLEQLVAASAAHGRESEPDHEVGDLQQILRSAWRRLTRAQRRRVHDCTLEDLLADDDDGHLQTALRSCWELLTPAKQREVFYENSDLAEWIDEDAPKTFSTSTVAGAAAGALVAGPVGALVGGVLGHVLRDGEPRLPRAVVYTRISDSTAPGRYRCWVVVKRRPHEVDVFGEDRRAVAISTVTRRVRELGTEGGIEGQDARHPFEVTYSIVNGELVTTEF